MMLILLNNKVSNSHGNRNMEKILIVIDFVKIILTVVKPMMIKYMKKKQKIKNSKIMGITKKNKTVYFKYLRLYLIPFIN